MKKKLCFLSAQGQNHFCRIRFRQNDTPLAAFWIVVAFFLLLTAAERSFAQDAAPRPEYGGKILMGSIGEPSNLIPYLASDSASAEVSGLLYTSPLEYDKDFREWKSCSVWKIFISYRCYYSSQELCGILEQKNYSPGKGFERET